MSIKSRFCVRCGRETVKLDNSLCADCIFSNLNVSVPSRLKLRVCKKCGSVEWKGNWCESDEPYDTFFKNMVIDSLRLPDGVLFKELELVDDRTLKLTISILERDYEQKYPSVRLVRRINCPECTKHMCQTYLARVQLRGPKDWLLEFSRALDRYSRYILKIEEYPNGIDVLFTKKEPAKDFISLARHQYKFSTKNTIELYSWDKAKCRPKTKNVVLLKLKEQP